MTHSLRIQYAKDRSVQVELDDYLYFSGANIELKRKIINCLNRFSYGKSLNEIEENIFGEEGIQIVFNDKPLHAKDISILYFNSHSSILNQFTMKRGSLLHGELLNFGNHLDVSIQMEKINNEILSLETLLVDKLDYLSEATFYGFKELLFQELVNKHMDIQYFENDTEIPIEYADSASIINKLMILIRRYIKLTGKKLWLVFDQPSNFINENSLNKLYNDLAKLSQETGLLNFFIFNQNQKMTNYPIEIEKTVVLYSEYQQLPTMEIFRNSIERHYPTELKSTDEELKESFFRISHLIGKNVNSKYSIAPKDMILLIIMKELLGDKLAIETSVAKLSQLEKNFLHSKF